MAFGRALFLAVANRALFALVAQVAKGTNEERILAPYAAKRDLADDLLEGTEEGGRLSYEDMLALVG